MALIELDKTHSRRLFRNHIQQRQNVSPEKGEPMQLAFPNFS